MPCFSNRPGMAYPELDTRTLPPQIYGGHQPVGGADVDARVAHTPSSRNTNRPDIHSRPGYYPAFATFDGPHWRVLRQWSDGVNFREVTSMTEGEGDRSIVNYLRLPPFRIPRRSASVVAVRNGLIFQTDYNFGDARVAAVRGLRR